MLARSSFRAGHAGQREREIGAASAAWWARPDGAWAPEEGLLAAGAAIVGRARAAVTAELGFTCSAGVAANKLLAKLCGGLHKPNQQTVLPPSAVHALLDPLPVDRLRGFGAKLGKLLREDGGFETCAALRRAGVPAVARLLRDGGWNKPEEMAAEAVRMAGGRDGAVVGERQLTKQVARGKQFGGRRGAARGPLDTREVIAKWVSELTGDIADRLAAEEEENDRVATKIIVGLGLEGEPYRSKRMALRGSSVDRLSRDCLQLIASLTAGRPPTRIGITLLNITADGFESTAAAGAADRGALVRMFAAAAPAAGLGGGGGGRHARLEWSEAAARGGGDAAGRRSGGGSCPAAAAAAWACARCTLVNVGSAARCAACDATRADSPAAKPAAPPAAPPVAPPAAPPVSPAPAPAPPPATAAAADWACACCTLLNDARANTCAVCGALRGGALPSASTLAMQQGGGRGRSPPQPARGRGGGARRRRRVAAGAAAGAAPPAGSPRFSRSDFRLVSKG